MPPPPPNRSPHRHPVPQDIIDTFPTQLYSGPELSTTPVDVTVSIHCTVDTTSAADLHTAPAVGCPHCGAPGAAGRPGYPADVSGGKEGAHAQPTRLKGELQVYNVPVGGAWLYSRVSLKYTLGTDLAKLLLVPMLCAALLLGQLHMPGPLWPLVAVAPC